MARMLAPQRSTQHYLNSARRHQHLARRRRQPALADGLQPSIDALVSAHKSAEEAEFQTQLAYDDIVSFDADLDDAVRNLFNDVEKHDRQAGAVPALPLLFPGGGFGDLIDESYEEEPDSVDALVVVLKGLGAGHPLAAHIPLLTAATKAVRDALDAHHEAIRQEKSAQAQEEIAQEMLRRKYESNFLDARKALGRVNAERLFPRLDREPAKRKPAAPQ